MLMSNKFVVLIDGGTKSIRDAITAELKKHGHGWWHYFGDSWLVETQTDISPNELYEQLKPVVGSTQIILVRVQPQDLEGMVPTTGLAWIRRWL